MALPTLSRTFICVPALVWKLAAILFSGLMAFVVLVELGEGSISPGVRLATALYGCLTLAAAKRAKWRRPRLYYKPWMGHVVVWTLIIGCIVKIVLPVITLLSVSTVQRRKAKTSQAAYLLKTSGRMILEYAKFHGGQLPPDMNATSISALLGTQWYKKKDNPFIDPYTHNPLIWQHTLSGRKIYQLKQQSFIVMGYSPEPVVDSGRLVCFLDGHVHWFRESEFKEKLREQSRLLSSEERVQQKIRTIPQ